MPLDQDIVVSWKCPDCDETLKKSVYLWHPMCPGSKASRSEPTDKGFETEKEASGSLETN